MEIEIKIDNTCIKPKIIICTQKLTQEISMLAKKLSDTSPLNLVGYKKDEIIIVKMDEVIKIYSEGQKVYVNTETEKLQLKFRLYELEEKFQGTQLIRISNSEIVNFHKVKSLDMSIGGVISLKLESGDKSFVSRRYIEKIKKYIGI